MNEQFFKNLDRLFWTLYGMGLFLADFLDLLVNFMIVSTRKSLISKEVDLFVVFKELQTVGLVPANGEYIKRDLSSNRVG